MITIYHNPKCSKSREGLQLLEELDKPFTIVKYLDATLTKDDLTGIIQQLGIKPIGLVRQKEQVWIDNYKRKELSDDEVIDILLKHPNLIERPIVTNGKKAVIGRPVENIKSIM